MGGKRQLKLERRQARDIAELMHSIERGNVPKHVLKQAEAAFAEHLKLALKRYKK